MFKNQNTLSIVTIASLILVGAFSRVLPHPPNFTAVGAIALFAGMHLRDKRLSFLIPIACMVITDLIIGFGFDPYVYVSFAIIVALGILIQNNKKLFPILATSIAGSILFFMITNFSVFIGSNMYPQNFQGLIACYVAGIPFSYNNLLADLFYNSVFFFAWIMASKKYPQLVS